MKNKFKVGDLIAAKKGTSKSYSITHDKNRFIGKVVGKGNETGKMAVITAYIENYIEENPESPWSNLFQGDFRKATWKEKKKAMVMELLNKNEK